MHTKVVAGPLQFGHFPAWGVPAPRIPSGARRGAASAGTSSPPLPAFLLTVTSTPTGAAFDIVLILHVGFVLIGFASCFATGIQAWRARGGPGSPAARSVGRYFRPGINWPGRSLYLVLVLGVLLVLMSQHSYGFGDPFVQLGFVFWILALALAELVVWPGERQIQRVVADDWGGGAASGGASGSAGGAAPEVVDAARNTALRVALSAWGVCFVLLVAIVLMVQKP